MSVTGPDPLERETPPWYDEAKLGIFIHWGVHAVPAYAPLSRDESLWDLSDDADGVGKIWRRLPHAAMYLNTLLIPDSPTARYHAERYGDLPYDGLCEQFRTDGIPRLDPQQWAEACELSGAGYVVLTTKLPDGFRLWPSEVLNPHKPGWQSDRDVVGEVAEAIRGRGLRFGTYYCGGTDATFGRVPMTSIETMIGALPPGDVYRDYATAQWREIVERYEPAVLWNDFCFPGGPDHVRALFRDYLARVPDGVINNRFQESANSHMQMSPVYSDFITPEYSVEGAPEVKWEACRSVGLSFGYNALESDETYLSAAELIHLFADVVARGGNLLLNIDPTLTGEIPFGQVQRLAALGHFIRTSGEAIRGSRPWERHAGITGDGTEIRYTRARDAVHAIVLGTPKEAAVEIDVRLDEGAEVELVGAHGSLPWRPTPAGTLVTLPERPPAAPYLCLRLSAAGAVHPLTLDMTKESR